MIFLIGIINLFFNYFLCTTIYIQTEIQTLAEAKIPGSLEAQHKYAKQYRINVHQWSYGRLMENIESQANKIGIVMEKATQPTRASPQQQATTLAIEAYQSRITS